MKNRVVATVSQGELDINFGDRLIITGPGPDEKPDHGKPYFTAALNGSDKLSWEQKLAEANLGNTLTRFIKRLAVAPGAELIEAYPHRVTLKASVFAKAGPPALLALHDVFGISPQVTWAEGRPIKAPASPPFSHMGL